MKKESQYYSKITLQYLQEHPEHGDMVTYGDLSLMEDLFDLLGGDRRELKISGKIAYIGHNYRFQFVLNKLDKESKQPDAIFEKWYLNYPGIINKPTRAFKIKRK